jgi:hypothetical protein
LSDRHGIDDGSNNGEGGGGGRAADAMLLRDPWGEAVAACGDRVAAWAGRRDGDGDAGSRQGVVGRPRPRQRQLRLDETRAPRLPAKIIVVDLLLLPMHLRRSIPLENVFFSKLFNYSRSVRWFVRTGSLRE